MTCQLVALTFDASDPRALAGFWAGILGWELVDDDEDCIELLPSDDTGFGIQFLLTADPKIVPNHMHLDLTSTSFKDQRHTVTRALRLGARHLDIGQGPDASHVVLCDPEGNEFCVIEPGNSFLADCGFIGALACEGTREVGNFWSAALGWPLVWDQDEETAIRSPRGGPKTAKYRPHFDLAPPVDGDQQAEVERLVSLGAARTDIGQGDVNWVVMVDPDGHEFCVLTPR
jgi:predicted enzyme related to lactoylglutathione lyase